MKAALNMERAEPGPMGLRGRFRWLWGVLCVYWVGIFIISHIPKSSVPAGWCVSGVLRHVGAYSVLTVLLFTNAGYFGKVGPGSKKVWFLVGVIGAYAALDEVLQLFVEGRSGKPIDWAVDMAACLVCVGLLWVVRRLWYRG